MYTKLFWKDIFERAVATFAQTLLALAGAEATDFVSLDWTQMTITSLVAAGLAVLKGVAVIGVGGERVPSVIAYEYDELIREAPDNPDELDDEEDPDLVWEDEPVDEARP